MIAGDVCTTSATLDNSFIIAEQIPELQENFFVYDIIDSTYEVFADGIDYPRELCPAWSRDVAEAEESSWTMAVFNSNYWISAVKIVEKFYKEVSGKCFYASCSNRGALDLGEKISADQEELRLDDLTYYL